MECRLSTYGHECLLKNEIKLNKFLLTNFKKSESGRLILPLERFPKILKATFRINSIEPKKKKKWNI